MSSLLIFLCTCKLPTCNIISSANRTSQLSIILNTLAIYNILWYSYQTGHDHMSKDTELMQYTIPEADLMKQYRKPEQVTESSTCTICNNRRPNIEIGKDFRYVELAAATDGFSPHNSLSKSDSSRPSFRGQLRSKLKIVVKKQRLVSSQEHMTFKSEVVYRLCRARHKNVIMLLGFCIQRTQGLLVYEYACNGSLKEHLSSKKSYLQEVWTFFWS